MALDNIFGGLNRERRWLGLLALLLAFVLLAMLASRVCHPALLVLCRISKYRTRSICSTLLDTSLHNTGQGLVQLLWADPSDYGRRPLTRHKTHIQVRTYFTNSELWAKHILRMSALLLRMCDI